MRVFILSFAALSFVLTTGCSTDCTDLEREANSLKNELGACSAGDACTTVSVQDDCLGGALVCGFPVPTSKVEDARRRAQELADESRSCTTCATASCAARGEPTCDTTAGRCAYHVVQ
jgi:hypothetical protein